ncbi:TetR/AcrR family transcriptional regulator [Domibacillus mangrovi]|uniref:TetR family transcriptional regulator n=1 Tax=Domibacillus mangrovi TaxID=1714354 RepID=A0A1Q5P6E0_9BACI|nr:TetR/AcrR family transcriptional regulator [Domibacillus mangrovi]OKL37784.1 TetR family transcriptional regulator [Domibacillus mangrovi]
MNARKQKQTARMHDYFIEAAATIIEEKGIEHVTARGVADIAGYTSSTIYNYFKELSHLIFFASMRFLDDYNKDLSTYTQKAQTPLDKYLVSWECFCKHSFAKPQIYHAIFISDLGEHPNELIKHYYSVYSNDFDKFPDQLKNIMLEHDIAKRSKPLLIEATQNENFNEENIDFLLQVAVLVWKGMLTTILNNRLSYSPEQATKVTMDYIKEITLKYQNSN